LRQSNCFHLTSYIIIVLIPQVRKSMWEFCQLLNASIPLIHSGTGEITLEWV
jgi:hypothetical protein